MLLFALERQLLALYVDLMLFTAFSTRIPDQAEWVEVVLRSKSGFTVSLGLRLTVLMIQCFQARCTGGRTLSHCATRAQLVLLDAEYRETEGRDAVTSSLAHPTRFWQHHQTKLWTGM